MARMKLLTQALLKQLPALYANEDKGLKDSLAYVKFFMPDGGWTWYASEYDGEDIFFGLVNGRGVRTGLLQPERAEVGARRLGAAHRAGSGLQTDEFTSADGYARAAPSGVGRCEAGEPSSASFFLLRSGIAGWGRGCQRARRLSDGSRLGCKASIGGAPCEQAIGLAGRRAAKTGPWLQHLRSAGPAGAEKV